MTFSNIDWTRLSTSKTAFKQSEVSRHQLLLLTGHVMLGWQLTPFEAWQKDHVQKLILKQSRHTM
ncbi:hypothetical protein ABS858_21430 [Vibrio neptunius]|uniref:hypothetical protein n=1 Tax=Vibrio neptunius TaxID=170651 RepID=UPI0033147EC2